MDHAFFPVFELSCPSPPLMAKYWAKPHLKSKTLREKKIKKEEAMLFDNPTGPAMTGKRLFYLFKIGRLNGRNVANQTSEPVFLDKVCGGKIDSRN